MLSIILQSSAPNQKRAGEIDGMETLLVCVSVSLPAIFLFYSFKAYKRNDAPTAEEAEFAENLYNCICSMLTLHENQSLLDKSKGQELMLIVIKYLELF